MVVSALATAPARAIELRVDLTDISILLLISHALFDVLHRVGLDEPDVTPCTSHNFVIGSRLIERKLGCHCNKGLSANDFRGKAGLFVGDEDELARLMRAGIAGNERAYGEFLQRVASLVTRFAQRGVERSGIDPEDIVQETLIAIHIKRHTWRHEAPVISWVYAIAQHKLADAFRRRKRQTRIKTSEPEAAITVEAQFDRVSEREIGRALRMLAPGQRSVVTAISIDGHSISDTAKNLGMSEAAVRVALHRALKAIANRFGQS